MSELWSGYELTPQEDSGRPQYEQGIHDRVGRGVVYTEDQLRLAVANAIYRARPTTIVLGDDIYLERGPITLGAEGLTLDGGGYTIRTRTASTVVFKLTKDDTTVRNLTVDINGMPSSGGNVVFRLDAAISRLHMDHVRIRDSAGTARDTVALGEVDTANPLGVTDAVLHDVTILLGATREARLTYAKLTRCRFSSCAASAAVGVNVVELLSGSDGNLLASSHFVGDLNTVNDQDAKVGDCCYVEGTHSGASFDEGFDGGFQ